MPPVKSFGERIADALMADGLIHPKQVEELLELQKQKGTRLIKLIAEKGLVSDQDMTVSMGRVLNVPPVNLSRLAIPGDVAEIVPRDMAHNHKVIPLARLENKLLLAMADPLNVLAIDDVRRITKMEVSPMIASEKAIMDKLAQAEHIVLVLSDAYFRSEYCMFELCGIYQHRSFADFRKRVHPVVLRGTHLHDPVERIKFVEHWIDKKGKR